MKRCRWKSFFENPKPVVSNVEPSASGPADQKRPRRPKWLGLSVIAFVLVVAGAAAEAQQPKKVPRIGYLSRTGDSKNPGPQVEGFRQGLRDLGYVEEKNILVEYRYGADLADSYRRVAYFVDRILKGAKPADLPVQQPTKFELIINLKTAKQIDVTIPQSMLYRADRVIR